jgi:hypothetical protein
MARAFNDTDGDGAVTRAELAARDAAVFSRIDRNDDGAATAADFGRGCPHGAGATTRGRRPKAPASPMTARPEAKRPAPFHLFQKYPRGGPGGGRPPGGRPQARRRPAPHRSRDKHAVPGRTGAPSARPAPLHLFQDILGGGRGAEGPPAAGHRRAAGPPFPRAKG